MLRVFHQDLGDPSRFVITIELVPGAQPSRQNVDGVLKIAEDAFQDGRVSAVSITDNPGGNPALAPDALASKIFAKGMDAIVHFTCRDMNRGGMESRAMQLGMVGMKNILALNGDYIGTGFGGQGTPVFDIDSVNLICMLKMLNKKARDLGDPEDFFVGCAVSPFKQTEAETIAQYAKMSRKLAAGADFIITQLGYDARKFDELIRLQKEMGCNVPTLASLYILTPGAARIMNRGKIPGCLVTDKLLKQVESEWTDKAAGFRAAVERSAKLGVVLKGLGYRGIHIGGIHKSFELAARVLDRMEQIEDHWRDFLSEFDYPMEDGYYVYPKKAFFKNRSAKRLKSPNSITTLDRWNFLFMNKMHGLFFNFDSHLASYLKYVARILDKNKFGRALVHIAEHPIKIVMFSCQRCGDCGIQHLGFQCPESGCPKHTRNGACGGSRSEMCEVRPEQLCVWVRAYRRWDSIGSAGKMFGNCVPPRMWELNHSCSWLNFHLGRDHQTASVDISEFCSGVTANSIVNNEREKLKSNNKP
jgi:methylenetetrahydrofolate reductase (NADPH)